MDKSGFLAELAVMVFLTGCASLLVLVLHTQWQTLWLRSALLQTFQPKSSKLKTDTEGEAGVNQIVDEQDFKLMDEFGHG